FICSPNCFQVRGEVQQGCPTYYLLLADRRVNPPNAFDLIDEEDLMYSARTLTRACIALAVQSPSCVCTTARSRLVKSAETRHDNCANMSLRVKRATIITCPAFRRRRGFRE